MKRRTEKQLKEKIKEINERISYQKRGIKRAEEEIAELELLRSFYEKELAKKYSNPSSVEFGGPKDGKEESSV